MINGITSADVQQLAQGIVPAYLQRYPLPELVQELATRLVYAEKTINEAYDKGSHAYKDEDTLDSVVDRLEEYDEHKDNY